VPGKVDWLVNRRRVEGTRADEPTVAGAARDDAVTCSVDDRVGEVRGRVRDSPYPFALVLSSTRVVLGRLPSSKMDCDPELPVEAVMDPGPRTVRPHKTAEGIAQDLAERELRWAIVTTPDGELIGVASRSDLEAAVKGRG
jgi:CBS domain-containing protein